MKKVLLIGLAVLSIVCAATSSGAGGGNGAPSGPHYNLNIIGVDNPKKSPMTASNRHTIFVALGATKASDPNPVETDIWLTPGEFQVCDGNGFDAAPILSIASRNGSCATTASTRSRHAPRAAGAAGAYCGSVVSGRSW